MANDVSANPHSLDTVGSSSSLAFPSTVFCEHVEMSDYAADTDVAVIKNRAGKVVVSLNGASDLQTVRTGKIGKIEGGYYVSTLTTGAKLRMYIR